MTTDDPFEHIEKQLKAYELIETYKEKLLADARHVIAQDPTAQIVGLILDADTDIAAAFLELVEANPNPNDRAGFVSLVPRDHVLPFLRTWAPAAMEWLDESGHSDTHLQLPIIAAASDGLQLATFTVRRV